MKAALPSPRWITPAIVALLAFFALTRFADLSRRPFHHDEGVNANFMKILVTTNVFRYDPQNYHGPTLFYLELPFVWLNTLRIEGAKGFSVKSTAGMTPAILRGFIALGGVLVLIGLALSRRRIGAMGALAAVTLAGISPNLLFFSRYFIHEIFVVLFTLGLYLSLVWYRDTHRPQYLELASVNAALLFCTKETALFTFVVLLLAYLCAEGADAAMTGASPWRAGWDGIKTFFREIPDRRRTLLRCAFFALFLWLLFFSSFFNNWPGLVDSIRTFLFWTKEGLESGHVKPFNYYLHRMIFKYEGLLLALSALGVLIGFVRRHKHAMFIGFWSMGITAAYSLIPYKTPWLIVNLVVPMALAGGYAVQEIADALRAEPAAPKRRLQIAMAVLLCATLAGAQVPETIRMTYIDYDSDRYEQIYAHTSRDVFNLVRSVEQAALTSGQGREMKIAIVSKEYWPLPFYLMKFPRALFYGAAENPAAYDAPVFIAESRQVSDVISRLGGNVETRAFTLRPGVQLHVITNRAVVRPRETSVLAFDTTVQPKDPKPGLRKTLFGNGDFRGEPLSVADVGGDISFWWDSDAKKPHAAPFSIEWTGFIRVPAPGTYQFALESDDGSWLEIDGKPVIDNGGPHALIKVSRTVKLAAGFHSIRIRYFDVGGGAVLRFLWTRPGAAEQPVPSEVLFRP